MRMTARHPQRSGIHHSRFALLLVGFSLVVSGCEESQKCADDPNATTETCPDDATSSTSSVSSSSGGSGGGNSSSGSASIATLAKGTEITFADITQTGFSVNWGAASSPDHDASELEYKLVMGDADTLSSIATIEDSQDVVAVLPYTKATLTYSASGLDPEETITFAVIVKDPAGNKALYDAASVTTLAQDVPTPGTAITFGLITDTSFSIYWGPATSTKTTSANLEYKVVKADATSTISTIASADAITGSDIVLDWTKARAGATYTPAGEVKGSKTYAIAVLVKDEYGGKSIYTPQTVTTLPHKLIFVSTTKYANGALNLATLDANCDAEKPAGRGSFKAMVAHSSYRIACLHADCIVGGQAQAGDGYNWVMTGSTTYENKQGNVVWTTTAGGVVSRLDYFTSGVDSTNPKVWTGLNANWTTGNNCSDWQSSANGVNSVMGGGGTNYTIAWSWVDSVKCDGSQYGSMGVYCVEQ